MGRSRAYWKSNLYREAEPDPDPAAPLRDLPPNAAHRFRLLRDGLLRLPEIRERVRYMGDPWRWAWEYGRGPRKLCWLHIMETGVAGTFTLTQVEESQLDAGPRLAAVVRRAVDAGQRTGPVRWCGIEFTDVRSVEGFLGFARRKAAWLAAVRSDQTFGRSRAG